LKKKEMILNICSYLRYLISKRYIIKLINKEKKRNKKIEKEERKEK
jgi:hypothetical protein